MARRPLQLAAALALVIGLLGLSTALVAEVREEVLAAQQAEQQPTFSPSSPEQQGLPVSEFTLEDPAEIDWQAEASPGGVTTLDQPAKLFLEPGDTIRVSAIPIPGASRLELPRGGENAGHQVHCPRGCALVTTEGPTPVPPNATVVLPNATPLEADPGSLSPGASFDLAPGARVFLAPITMDRATTLPLGPGSQVLVPQSASTPLPNGQRGLPLLPSGTVIRGGEGQQPGFQDLLDEARQEPTPTTVPQELARAQKPTIEVTDVPEAIQKDAVFTVGGTVVGPDGEPSVGHPVTIYANQTKQAPGFEIQLGNVVTDEEGRFEARARIPGDKPAQPYHIVARAHPISDHDPPLVEAWSDPIVGVRADTRLQLDIPDVEGKHVPVPLRAKLVDVPFGTPVPGQVITFQVDGSSRGPMAAITDENGEALVILEDGFGTPGFRTVTVRFDGTQHLTAVNATEQIEILDATIRTDPTIVAPRGQTATLNGQVQIDGDREANLPVVAAFADQPPIAVSTDEHGTFQLHFDVPGHLAVGNHTMVLETQDPRAQRSVVVTVTGQTRLQADPPPHLPLGGNLPLQVKATDELGTALAGHEVSATTPEGRRQSSLSDERGIATVPASLSTGGTWTLNVTTPGSPLYAGAQLDVPVSVGPLSIDADPRIAPGQTRNITLTTTIGEAPLAGERVEVRGLGTVTTGTTDPSGTVTLPFTTPASAEPGPVELAVELPRYNMVERIGARILEQPTLDLTVLDNGQGGQPVQVEVLVIGRDGALAGVPVTVTAEGAFQATGQGITDEIGKAQVELPRPREADGLAVLTATAEETGTTSQAVRVASVEVTASPFPWWTVALGVGAVMAGALAVLWYRNRPEKAPPPGPTLELSIEPQGQHLPPVWHPGDPTHLHVRLLDKHGTPIPGATVHLSGPHGRARVTLDEAGRARIKVPATRGKVLDFHATYPGSAHHDAVETSLEVRLVDYREEIDREYRDLRELAEATGRCGRDATPRELARSYRDETAEEVASLFERADYSPHPVDRADYVTFMNAKRSLLQDVRDPGTG